MRHILAIGLLVACCQPNAAKAHGGGLDASGCHNDRKRGGYHCHRAPSFSVPAPDVNPAPKPNAPEYPNPLMSNAPQAPLMRTIEGGDDPEVTIQPDKKPYWSDGPWSVYSYPDENSCEIGIVPKENEYLSLRHDPRDRAAFLMITNSAATSKRDGERVTLDIVFLTADDFGPSWVDTNFTIKVLPNGNRAMVSEALDQKFLTAFAANEILAVVAKSWSIVGGANLTKSGEAIRNLRQCALEAAELNPNDPFLEGI